jgi:hypothetical protein
VYVGPRLARRLAPSPAPDLATASGGALRLPLTARAAVVPLFVLALLRTAAVSFTPFLYFQF